MDILAAIMGLNFIDVLMAVIIAAVIYTGRKEGIVAEFFKLFGVVCTVFITLHYYVRLADFLRDRYFDKDAATEFFAFSLLAILIFLAFVFTSKGWVLILRLKSFAFIDRWGGLFISLMRGYFICGLVFLALLLARHSLATPQAHQSLSQVIFRNAAVGLYEATYSVLVKNFFPGEEMNEEVFKLAAEKPKKNIKK